MWVHNTDIDTWKLWLVPPRGLTDKHEFYRRLFEIATNHRAELGSLILLCHKLLRRDGAAIEALQHGHRGRLLTSALISRRRMVAIEFGM
jgi:hypothetical protein